MRLGFPADLGAALAVPAAIERVLLTLNLEGGAQVLDLLAESTVLGDLVAGRLTTGRLVRVSVLSWPGSLRFPDACFDAVISGLALHCVQTPAARARLLSEAVRVLKPGGQLLVMR